MWYGSTRDEIRLVKTDIFITEKCNLKCAHCSSLMQYFKNPKNVELEDIKKGLEKFFSLISYSGFTAILGGEPFLNPDLSAILKEVIKYRKQIGELSVTTNGTIIPTSEQIEALKETDIKVNISLYKTFQEKQLKLVSALERENVRVELFDPYWTYRTQRYENDGNIFYKYCKKMCAPCVTLRGLQLWFCEFANNVNSLGNSSEHINLLSNITKEQVYDYLNPVKPFAACQFCSGAFSDIKIENAEVQCEKPQSWGGTINE